MFTHGRLDDHRKTQAGQDGLDQGRTMVDGHGTAHGNVNRTITALQAPPIEITVARGPVVQTAMTGQVGGVFRDAVLGEVFGRRHDQGAHVGPKRQLHQILFQMSSNTYPGIEPTGNDVRKVIVDIQIDGDIWIGCQEAFQRRNDNLLGRMLQNSKAYGAGNLRMSTPCLRQTFVDLAQCGTRNVEQPSPAIGEPHASGAALEQYGAKPILQSADRVAYARLRPAQPRSRTGKTAFLGHGHERKKIRKVAPVHLSTYMIELIRLIRIITAPASVYVSETQEPLEIRMTPLKTLIRSTVIAGGLALVLPALAQAEVDNIVLVHGMNMDGSMWRPVYDLLVADDYHVTVVQLPQTSAEDDINATRRALDGLTGDILLVGHSYGGMVISDVGNDPDVLGLVYVAAFQPAPGETMGELSASVPSDLPADGLRVTEDGYISITFEVVVDVVASGLSTEEAQYIAHSQRAASMEIMMHPAGEGAWQAKPVWAVIATQDHVIAPELQERMSDRSGATVTRIDGGHLLPLTDPAAIAEVIKTAARSLD